MYVNLAISKFDSYIQIYAHDTDPTRLENSDVTIHAPNISSDSLARRLNFRHPSVNVEIKYLNAT